MDLRDIREFFRRGTRLRALEQEAAALAADNFLLMDRMRQVESSLAMCRSMSHDVAAAHRIALETLGGEVFDDLTVAALERLTLRSSVIYQRRLRREEHTRWRARLPVSA